LTTCSIVSLYLLINKIGRIPSIVNLQLKIFNHFATEKLYRLDFFAEKSNKSAIKDRESEYGFSQSEFCRMIRYLQLGAKDRIMENAQELWRCLHCGLCTQTCPREADPGEIILGLKRFVVDNWRRS